MKLGVIPTLATRDPATAELANAAIRYEQEGFDSLWVLQTLGRGFMMPDPFLSLATFSAVTKRISLGSAVIQLPHYGVGDMAHKLFTLRMLAGDRLKIGLGAGSTPADFQVTGADFDTRFKVFRQRSLELKQVLETGVVNDVDLTP